MSKLQTPFRYDFVGSFLRPQALKDAKVAFQDGKIKAKAHPFVKPYTPSINRIEHQSLLRGVLTGQNHTKKAANLTGHQNSIGSMSSVGA